MRIKTVSILRLLMMMAFLTLSGCLGPDYPDNIWDPDDEGAPTPVIVSVTPPDSAYGSIGSKKTVEITGEYFNESPLDNLVYFGDKQATVLESNPTKLIVEPPANFKDSLRLRVDAIGAYHFGDYLNPDSTWHYYKILNPVEEIGKPAFTFADNMRVMDVDKDGNLYVVTGKIIEKVTEDGTRIEFGEIRTDAALGNMRYGGNGKFHYTYSSYYFITTVNAGGESTHENFRAQAKVSDLDFDVNRNVWYVGDGGVIYVTKAGELDGTLLHSDDAYRFTRMRYYNGFLYIVGVVTESDGSAVTKIWKQEIDPSSSDPALVGGLIEIFNWSNSEYGGKTIKNIDLNADGEIYIGTGSLPLMKLDVQTGLGEILYPKLLSKYKATRMTWGIDDHIYINTFTLDNIDNDKILKVRVFEESAPYHGRQ
jgi:hypothetical protein